MVVECVEATSCPRVVFPQFLTLSSLLCYVLEVHPGPSENTPSEDKHHTLLVTWWPGGSAPSQCVHLRRHKQFKYVQL